MFTNPDCTCTPFIPELCPVCQAEMPPKNSLETDPAVRPLYDRIEAHNADLLAAAEALLDRLDTMTTEEFRHGGEREQRESLHAEVQKSKQEHALWWAEKERNRK